MFVRGNPGGGKGSRREPGGFEIAVPAWTGAFWVAGFSIETPGKCSRPGRKAARNRIESVVPRNGVRLGPQSGRAAPLDRLDSRRRYRRQGSRIGGVEANKNLIGRVLQAAVRLVQLPGGLASQLTKLVAVGHMRKCPKNKIGTHYSLSFNFVRPAGTTWLRRCSRLPTFAGAPGIHLPGFRRTVKSSSSKNVHPVSHLAKQP